MARTERTAHAPMFAEQTDFNEQLYKALKSSPWWMISIAVHVLMFVVSSMIQTDKVEVAAAPSLTASMNAANDAPTEDEPKPTPDEVDQVHDSDVATKEPTIKDAELSDHNETDNDLPTEESLGEGGLSDAPFDGPANNDKIGIGGSAGGAFRGRGGHHNLRAGRGGHPKADGAVDDALRWLKAHQSPDGGWEGEGFRRWCEQKPASGPGPDGAGKAQ